MKRLLSYCSLIRIHNCLMASLGVAAGQYLAAPTGQFRVSAPAMAAAFFVCGFGNVFNDLRDISSDRINHPNRVLPSGQLTVGQAKALTAVFAVVSLALLVLLDNPGRVISLTALALLIWYNVVLKQTIFSGNAVVALLTALTFILGGISYGWERLLAVPGPLAAAGLAFLMHLGREVIKDIGDREGDVLAGGQTAAVAIGVPKALAVAWGIFLVLMAASLGPYFAGWFSRIYVWTVLFLVVIPLVLIMAWVTLRPDRRRCRIAGTVIKVQMLAGTAALVFGKIS